MRSVRLFLANWGSCALKRGLKPFGIAFLFLASQAATHAQLGGSLFFTTNKFVVGEKDGTALITVSRDNEWGTVLVDLVVTNGTATNGVQFSAPAATNTLVFSNFQTSVTIPFTITDNSTTNAGSSPALIGKLMLANPRAATNEPSIITPKLGTTSTSELDILDNDGELQFNIEKTYYTAPEGGSVDVKVVLSAPPTDKAQEVSVDYTIKTDTFTRAGSDFAAANDYVVDPTTGTLTFGPDDTSQTITIAIAADQLLEFNEDFHVELSNPKGKLTNDDGNGNVTEKDYTLGPISKATITIPFNGPPPAGSVDLAYNADNDPTTVPASNVAPGANNAVFSVDTMPDGTAYIAGDFTSVDAISRVRIARLNKKGQVDQTFDPLGGANDFVSAIAAYKSGNDSGKVLVAGGFTSVNGAPRNGIARLNADGSIDNSFNPGNGANGPVYAIELLLDGKILIGGEFSSFDGVLMNRVARLLPNGQLDLSFSPGLGPDAPVYAVRGEAAPALFVQAGVTNTTNAIRFELSTNVVGNAGVIELTFNFKGETNDFQILQNGQEIYYSGLTNNLVVQTNADGSTTNIFPDIVTNISYAGANGNLTFVVNTTSTNGGSNWVFSARIRPNVVNGIYIAGEFTSVGMVPVGRIARLQNSGTLDTTYADGTGIGADGAIYALAVQSTNKLIAAGAFQTFNSLSSPGIVRLNKDGSVDRGFAVGLGTDGTVNTVTVQSDDSILIGGSFYGYNNARRIFLARLQKNGPLDTSFLDPAYNQFAGFPAANGRFPNGVVNSVAVDSSGGVLVGGVFTRVGGGETRTSIHPRINFARLNGGTNAGPGNISFKLPLYGGDENGGTLAMILTRTNGTLGDVLSAITFTDGAATSAEDYTGDPVVLKWSGATTTQTVPVPIIDDTLIEGDEDFDADLLSPIGALFLGGEYVSTAPAVGEIINAKGIILDNDVQGSTVFFSENEYDFNENDGTITINVYRTGNVSVAGTVRWQTAELTGTNFVAAIANSDYVTGSGSINFASGQTNRTFTVRLKDDALAEPDESFAVQLVSPSAGLTVASNNTARINIIDNDFAPGRVSFSATNYNAAEGTSAQITVTRRGGNVGLLQVHYTTSDGTATAPFDYVEQSGVLQWNDQEAGPKTITIPVSENGLANGNKTFNITLSDVAPNGSLGLRTNTVVTIVDNDALGSFSFNAPEFLADENGTNVIINVIRRGGSAEVATVQFATRSQGTNENAVAGQDYVSTNGTLTFGIGETSKSFAVRILDNSTTNAERVIGLVLSNALPSGALLGPITNATIAIIDNESINMPAGSVETDFNTLTGANNAVQAIGLQSDGKILIAGDFQVIDRQVRTFLARLNPDGTLDPKFGIGYNINDSVRALAVQNDGRILIGGTFTNIDGLPANHLARISSGGLLDSTFNTGSGADGSVLAVRSILVNGERKALIAGSFSVYNGVNRRGIARVNDDGKTDLTFNPGSGVNGDVYAIAVQNDGKILVGGEFTTVNGMSRINIARLNQDGSVDTTFDSGLGVDGPVRSILVQYDDKIVLGGIFTAVSGVTRHNIARVNSDGTVDISFNPGSGANGPVYTLALQLDGKILMGGDFTSVNGAVQNRIARLNENGAVDTSINFGLGANAFIGALAVQSDRRIVAGGGFTQFDGLTRNHYARIYGGSIEGPGELIFGSPNFTVNESTNTAVITVRRYGGLSGDVSVSYLTRAISAAPGADYQDVSGTLNFANGENYKTFNIPIIDDALAEPNEEVYLQLTNAVGALPLLRQPVSKLTIVSDDTVIEFADVIYNVSESAPGGRAVVVINRRGESTTTQAVNFSTDGGTATPGNDYTSVNTTVTFQPGEVSKAIGVPILDDSAVEDNETVTLHLTPASPGVTVGLATATLTIFDNDFAPGNLSVVQPAPVSENGGSISVQVTRASGRSGAVTVNYAVQDGTATSGVDYLARSGTLTFQEGETLKSILIPILDDKQIEGNESFTVVLSAPGGGAGLGDDTAFVTILDDDFGPGSLDTSFNIGSGASGAVRSLEIQPDGKILLGGEFEEFRGNQVGHVTRLNPDGSNDAGFSTGNGTDGVVYSVARQQSGSFGVGGDFGSFGNVFRPYVAQGLTNGFPDQTFSLRAGENDRVFTLAAQPDGKYIAGGDFTIPAAHILRLNADGSLDVSFNPDAGTDGTVNRVELQSDGKVLVGGSFSNVAGVAVRGFARVLSNGLLDPSFKIGTGVSGTVYAIAVSPDGKILIGGNFTAVNGASRTRIARLNSDGTIDQSFVPAVPNGIVYDIFASNGKYYIAGQFTQVGSSNRVNIARLNFDGSLDSGFDPGIGPDGPIYTIGVQKDGQVLIGGAFNNVNGFSTPGIARLNGDKTVPATVELSDISILNGTLIFDFNTVAGSVYTVETSSDLKTWETLRTITANGDNTQFTEQAGNNRKLFYRIRLAQ